MELSVDVMVRKILSFALSAVTYALVFFMVSSFVESVRYEPPRPAREQVFMAIAWGVLFKAMNVIWRDDDRKTPTPRGYFIYAGLGFLMSAFFVFTPPRPDGIEIGFTVFFVGTSLLLIYCGVKALKKQRLESGA